MNATKANMVSRCEVIVKGISNGQDVICMSIDENYPVLLLVIYNLQSSKITLIESDNQEVSFSVKTMHSFPAMHVSFSYEYFDTDLFL